MQILTPTGYKDASTLSVGDEVIGWDNGNKVTNTIEVIDRWTADTNPTDQGPFDFYLVNDKWNLYKNQSLFANDMCVHAFELNIGDTIYDENNNPVVVETIVIGTSDEWYRLEISGNHIYIADGLTVHNASRFWVGGGSSANWNATANTNWSATTGGSNNATVPGSSDAVTFDGAGASGNSNSTISAIITILSFTNTTGYTHTITTNAILTIAGNVTFATGILWAGASAWTISTTSTFTSGGVTFPLPLVFSNSGTNITISGNLSVSGLLTRNQNTGSIVPAASETVTLSGGITITGNYTTTCTTILTGGTWTAPGTATFQGPVTFNGNVTISGTVNYNGTMKYTSGTITTTSSTLSLNGATTFSLGTASITWNNVTIGAAAITFSDNLTMTGTLSINASLTTTFSGASFGITCGGFSIGSNGAINGTLGSITMTGGTFASSGNSTFNASITTIPFTINGSVTFSAGYFLVISTTFTFSSGTQSFNSGFFLGFDGVNNCVLTNNINGLTGLSVTWLGVATNKTLTVNGTNGIGFGTLSIQNYNINLTAGVILTFGNTYSIATAFTSGIVSNNADTIRMIVKSSSAGNQVVLTLNAGATQNIERTNFTDVDASAGQTIYTYSPPFTATVLSNTKNINLTPTSPITVSSAFIN